MSDPIEAMIERITDNLIALDAEWRCTYVNDSALANLRRNREEVMGKSLWEVFPEAVGTIFWDRCQEAMERQVPVEFEAHYQPYDIWVSVKAYPSPDGLTLCYRDVTRRRQAEEAVHASQKRYQRLFNSMTEGFAVHEIVCDAQGKPCDYRFLEINPAFELLTGLKQEDVIGRTVLEVLPDTEPFWIETYGQVALTGEPIRFEHYSQPLKRHYDVFAYCPAEKQFACLFLDITGRKQAEEVLRQWAAELQQQAETLEQRIQERTAELARANEVLQAEIAERKRAEQAVKAERQRLNDILEVLPAYVVLLTPDHQVPFANRFFRERFGESHGRRCFEYLFGYDEPCKVCESYTALKTGQPHHWEWLGPDGRNYDIFDFLFTDTDGSTFILEMGIDITAHKKAEDALREAHDTLEARVRERTAELAQANAQLQVEVEERRKAEQALRESEAKLRALFEILPVGLSIVDSEYNVQYTNPALSGILELPAEDVRRGTWRQRSYLRPDGSPMPSEEFPSRRALKEQRMIRDVEIGIVKEDGALIWTNVSAAPLPFTDWSGIIAVTNVTEQVRARQRIEDLAAVAQRRAAEMDAVFASIADGVILYTPDGRIARTNAAAEAFLSLTAGEGQSSAREGRPSASEDRPSASEDRPSASEDRPSASEGKTPHLLPIRDDGQLLSTAEAPAARALRGETVQGLIMGVHVDGVDEPPRWFSVSTAPVRDSSGQLTGAVASFTDVTEQKRMEAALRQARDELEMRVQERTAQLVGTNEILQAEIAVRCQVEEELRESELRFRQLAENIDEVFWLMEPDTDRLLYISPVYQSLWGRPAPGEDSWSDAFLGGVHAEDRERLAAAWQTQGARFNEEFRLVRPDGAQRWLHGRAFPIQDSRGQIQRVAGIVEDVTVQKETQAALIQAERLHMAGRLAASLAHEINNPLQSALGCLDLAREAVDDGRDPSRYLQVIAEALERAGGVVSQLRALHRQPSKEQRQPVELSSLLEKVLLLSQKKCKTQGVEVIQEIEQDLPPLNLMPNAMQQVFLNLVLNAVDAMPDGGELRVSVESCRRPDGVWIHFADTGTGLATQIRDRLFEPFQSTKSEGLGLGLFISQNIVQQHGGRIEAAPREGKGTVFSVWLPG